MSMGKRQASTTNAEEGDGEPVTTSGRPSQRGGNASNKSNVAQRNFGGDNTGAIVVSVLLATAAITATYWATTGNSRTRPAPPNAELRDVARQLLHPNKGILAADESPGTFAKRLGKGVPNTLAVRQQWRRALLSAPQLEEYISGVILHEETFMNADSDVQSAIGRGIAVGIKLDEGTVPLQPKKSGERATKGLEGLEERCTRFRSRGGAMFAKWRAVFRVGRHTPSRNAIRRNAADLAAFAAAAQACGVVPILEPEVLAEGDHDLQRGGAAAARVLRGVFRALRRRPDVDPGAMLLKVAFVTPGQRSTEQVEPHQVANATLRVLLRTVPRVVPGIVFLSGGQSEETATANLLALSQLALDRAQAGKPPLPWALSFSFSRALQSSALKAWQRGDVVEAQVLLTQRARANAQAQQGRQEDAAALAEGISPATRPGFSGEG